MANALPQAPAPPYALTLDATELSRFERMAARAWRAEGRLWARAGIVPGARVADVGCGPGAILRLLARIVGPTGAVIGVEPDATARTAAERAVAEVANVRVLDGDGLNTGLGLAECDAVMLRHVLFHCGDQASRIVAHVAERVRPGGHCYLVDTDLDAARMVPHHPDIVEERRRYVEFQRRRGNDVSIGAHLASIARDAGLELVLREARYHVIDGAELLAMQGGAARAARPHMIAAGMATLTDARRWDAAWTRLREAGTHVELLVPHFIAIGRRGM